MLFDMGNALHGRMYLNNLRRFGLRFTAATAMRTACLHQAYVIWL